MVGIPVDDLLNVYEQLKNRYDLVLTTTSALDEGFTIDCPIIVGNAHEQVIELYKDDELLVMVVMDAGHTMGTHWHPYDAESAAADMEEFMKGKSDYKMYPFRQV